MNWFNVILRKLFYALPPKLRFWSRRIFYTPGDWVTKTRYENGIPIPPKSMIFTGGGDFVETGFRFLNYFKTYAKLQPNHTVLDIGCGIGRIAIPLTHYLNDSGRYYGLDIMREGIKWCYENITTKFPNFQFTSLDLKNDLYRSKGGDPSKLHLPFAENNFDFICLISVFTHMQPKEVEQYISEISRCLKKGGTCLFTLFLYENERELVNNNFKEFIKVDEYHALMNKKVKSANVAYRKSFIKSLLKNNDLNLKYLSKGSWSKRKNGEDFQDFIVISKP